ncbi:hypothetical protein [Microbacterium sp. SD291]|uniref:hypothetical protein n=1 Tax=Microbacterium sp. SD291 TaxID=2782007 RepID=UPI001A975FEE|nr:hypothetical protein [Microbacterium sp. SD291]MBO0981229.1 hypothetical protein [Microbacterium sp. SD291]
MSHRRSRSGRSFIAAVALSLFALASPVALAPAASADPPPPETMTVVARTSPDIAAALGGVPAQALPDVLTAAGVPFEIEISLSSGSAPDSFATDTVIALSAGGPGQLSTVQVTMPAGQSSMTTELSYSAATAGIQVTAVSASSPPLSATTASFPVDLSLTLLDGGAAALRNGTAGADAAGCTTVDAAHPMCGVISLPRGAEGTVALSLGVCPAGQTCAPGALVTQLIADLSAADGDIYTRTSPARMTIVCDKSICAQNGVRHYRALWSESATGALLTAPACPAKGVIGADQDFCTDWVSSSRDRAGDLRLVVLFLRDVRGTI